MVTHEPQDRADHRERAAALLHRVNATLAAPRPDAPRDDHAARDAEWEAWQARKAAETRAAEAARHRPAPAAPPGNVLTRMTDEQVVSMLGQIAGALRREMMDEIKALAELVAGLETRLARIEGQADE